MKKLIYLFLGLLLFISTPAVAWMSPVIAGGGVPVAGGEGPLCASCTPGDPADIFCEDFGGSNLCASGEASVCHCTWTVNTGARVTFAEGKVTIQSDAGNSDVTANYDMSDGTIINLKFVINIDSESLADDQKCRILLLRQTFDNIYFNIAQRSGSLYIDVEGYFTGDIAGTTAIDGVDDVITIFANIGDSQAGVLSVNGSSQGNFWVDYEGDFIELRFGSGEYDSGNATVSFSEIQADDDTMP